MRALLFTQQTVGLGFRKTGMVNWAETLAGMGWHVDVVTVQLSIVTAVANRASLTRYPRDSINCWRERGLRLRGFIWVPPLHPFSFGPLAFAPFERVAAFAYAKALPQAILDVAAQSNLIVIESTAAVALFSKLKQHAPRARFVYCASDRLVPNGMASELERILQRSAPLYDLVRVPASSMINDFPPQSNVKFIPQGVNRALLSTPTVSPYPPMSRNLVVAGDMAFDALATRAIVEVLSDCTVHLFGRMATNSLGTRPNVIFHGEVPFHTLVPYLQHADVGIAPYQDRPNRNYLAESSLRQLQYIFCRLPIVIPGFAAPRPMPYHFLYDATRPSDAAKAARNALAFDRSAIQSDGILDWNEVVARVLELVRLGS